jgi:hypothetical protein
MNDLTQLVLEENNLSITADGHIKNTHQQELSLNENCQSKLLSKKETYNKSAPLIQGKAQLRAGHMK